LGEPLNALQNVSGVSRDRFRRISKGLCHKQRGRCGLQHQRRAQRGLLRAAARAAPALADVGRLPTDGIHIAPNLIRVQAALSRTQPDQRFFSASAASPAGMTSSPLTSSPGFNSPQCGDGYAHMGLRPGAQRGFLPSSKTFRNTHTHTHPRFPKLGPPAGVKWPAAPLLADHFQLPCLK
jgi:hypothetical protein